MPPFATEAVILHSRDFQESDRMITFYSGRLGKVKGIAKGAKRSRKRFGSNLDLLAHVRLHGFEKKTQDLVRIDGSDILEYFGDIRQDVHAFARACYLSEWVAGCTVERQPLPGLLTLLIRVLNSLGKLGSDDTLLRIFEAKLLGLAGYDPRLKRCVSCGRTLDGDRWIHVDVPRGGVVCKSCKGGRANAMRISLGTAKLIEDAKQVPLNRLHRIAFSAASLKESRELLRAFYVFHVGRELKSITLLDTFGS